MARGRAPNEGALSHTSLDGSKHILVPMATGTPSMGHMHPGVKEQVGKVVGHKGSKSAIYRFPALFSIRLGLWIADFRGRRAGNVYHRPPHDVQRRGGQPQRCMYIRRWQAGKQVFSFWV